jgi:hypothetical protein
LGDLGALDALSLPVGLGGRLGQPLLDVIAWPDRRDLYVDLLLVGGCVFARQDESLCPCPVLEGIPARSFLALGRALARTLLGVLSIDFYLVL